jgi:hypothetical protein
VDSGTGRLMVYPVWERQSDAVPSAASGLPTSAPNGARPRVSQAHEDDLGPAGASERREVGGPPIEQRVLSDRQHCSMPRRKQASAPGDHRKPNNECNAHGRRDAFTRLCGEKPARLPKLIEDIQCSRLQSALDVVRGGTASVPQATSARNRRSRVARCGHPKTLAPF